VTDRFYYFETLGDTAKNGVAFVEPWRRNFGDEELASVGVGAGIGHREGSRFIMFQLGRKFILKRIAGPAAARAGRVSGLDHEFGDDAMKNDPVIESFFGQCHKIRNGFGRLIRVKFGLDGPLSGFDLDFCIFFHDEPFYSKKERILLATKESSASVDFLALDRLSSPGIPCTGTR